MMHHFKYIIQWLAEIGKSCVDRGHMYVYPQSLSTPTKNQKVFKSSSRETKILGAMVRSSLRSPWQVAVFCFLPFLGLCFGI
jgi:hypothetical protein